MIVDRVVREIDCVEGIVAIVLGGSHARGRDRPTSDIDMGLYYRDDKVIDTNHLATAVRRLSDHSDPVVTDLGEWGPWVNGGAWLTIEGGRVDLLYRSLDTVERVLSDARAGRYEIHYTQQPPFGFFSPTLLGEVDICVPLFEHALDLTDLKKRVRPYPPALQRAVIQNCLWGVEFGLKAFAPKFAERGDAYGTVGCVSRFSHFLVLALFALNETYLLNEKTALEEIDGFTIAPQAFSERIRRLLSNAGASPDGLALTVAGLTKLFEEIKALAGAAYVPEWEIE